MGVSVREKQLDSLLEQWDGAISIDGRSSVNVQLEARLTEAQWVWPDIGGDLSVFAGYIGGRLPEGDDLSGQLEKLKVSDLYLAWGCSQGDAVALAAFATHFDEMVEGAVRRFAKQGLDVEEAKQKVLEYILFPTGKRAAAISLYGGHGSLKGYLGVTVVREVLRMIKANKKMPAVDMQDPGVMLADVSDDPELQMLKNRYRTEFKSAFQDAMTGLDPSDRNLLRYYYVSDLTLTQIAAISGVKHNTVSRRLAKVRSTLLTSTRDGLLAMAGVDQHQFDSIVRLVQSQLNVSMYRILKPSEEGQDSEQ
jgi:RNA polymerase sigma-70 factor, ECF subfamily